MSWQEDLKYLRSLMTYPTTRELAIALDVSEPTLHSWLCNASSPREGKCLLIKRLANKHRKIVDPGAEALKFVTDLGHSLSVESFLQTHGWEYIEEIGWERDNPTDKSGEYLIVDFEDIITIVQPVEALLVEAEIFTKIH